MEHGMQWAWYQINTSTVLKDKINCLSKHIYVDKTCTQLTLWVKLLMANSKYFPLSSNLRQSRFFYIVRVAHIIFLCYVAFCFVFFAFVLTPCPMLHASPDCQFVISLSGFSNGYLFISKTDIMYDNQKHIFPIVHIRVVFTLICLV